MKTAKPRSMGATNRAAVLSVLRAGVPLTVPGMAERTRLSRMTVGKIVGHLLERGIVVPAGKGSSTVEGGKKPGQYRLNADFARAIGVHVYPDRIEGSSGDLTGAPRRSITVATRPREDPASLAAKIARLCDRLAADPPGPIDGLIGVAVAFPGICDRGSGTVLHSPWFPHWAAGVPLADLIGGRLTTSAPVSVDNEFRYMVLAEQHLRGLAGDSTLIVIGGGRGLGAGIRYNGGIMRGPRHLAGEIGHMVLQVGGEPCSCGGRGCFEAMVHERRVLRLIHEARRDHRDSLLFRAREGETGVMPLLFSAAAANDPLALRVLDDLIGWFALAISNIIVCIDPDVLAIHGVYRGAGEYFLREVRRRVGETALPAIGKNHAIEYSLLGPSGGTEGALRHLVDDYFSAPR